LASVFIAKRMAYTIRVVQERPDDELSDCRADFLRKV
jgi:hypothetical protein